MGAIGWLWRRRLPAAVVAGSVGLIAASGGFALGSAPITASPDTNAYSAPTFTIDRGEVAVFQNTGNTAHGVEDFYKDGGFFHTPRSVPPGASAEVDGTQYLEGGTWSFICPVHGGSMSAQLVVSGSGKPQSRPRITVRIVSSSIKRVRSSGKLKVKVRAITAAPRIELDAHKGFKRLTRTESLDLAAGSSAVVSLQLTRSGRKTLSGDAATITAFGLPEFANGAGDTKTLR